VHLDVTVIVEVVHSEWAVTRHRRLRAPRQVKPRLRPNAHGPPKHEKQEADMRKEVTTGLNQVTAVNGSEKN
jgi:hypothetical protein